VAKKNSTLVGALLSLSRSLGLPAWGAKLRRSSPATSGRWLRRREKVGERYSEPAPTRSKRTAAEKAPRIRAGRFAQAVRASLGALVFATPLAAVELESIGRFSWQMDAVNGVSGLVITKGGKGFVAVSDLGWRLEGTLARQGDAIAGVSVDRIDPIRSSDGYPVAARRVGDWSDAEGLAIAKDGTEYISFERWPHVWRFTRPNTNAQWIKDHPTFYDMGTNRQLEALALDPAGTLYVFPERPFSDGFPIYRLDDDRWTLTGHFPERDGFSVVGADFDREGVLYLLERKLELGIWWRSRVRRLTLDGQLDEAIWTSGRDDYTNLEGISLWYDDEGARITLVSDNNKSVGEPTEFVEFRLTE